MPAGTSKNILVIDDEANMRHMLSTVLEQEGYQVTAAADGLSALSILEDHPFDLILCDLRMPQMDGLSFLEKLTTQGNDTTTIVMSAYGNIDTAVQAMRHGAADYISKPFKPDEIIVKLAQAEERTRLRQENLRLRSAVEREFSFASMVAKSKAMREIFETVKKITDYKTTTLITGESGTGKELIARAIHYNGTRKKAPMVAVNCGGLPENLLESELFGYVKGAFTDAVRDKAGLFREANGGTLFLDEIGDLPSPLQVKLLRVLQDEIIRPLGSNDSIKVDVRIIAATAVDLAQRVKAGKFRDDLFYRINVLNIHIPPLRERREDIPLLVDFFVQKHNGRMKKDIQGFSPDALQLLVSSPWPGNVRELENIIERTMVLTENNIIQKRELSSEIFEQKRFSESKDDMENAATPDSPYPFSGFSIKSNTICLEKRLIAQALKETDGNRTHAAKLLEISHPTLLAKMKSYNLT